MVGGPAEGQQAALPSWLIEQFLKSHNAAVPYPTMLHSEQKCAHFCSEWSLVGYGTGAICDLWIRSIAGWQSQSEKWNRFGILNRRGSTKNFPVTRYINSAGFSANNIAWKLIRKSITPAYIMVKWYITNISNLTNFDIFSFTRFNREYYMDLSK